MFTIRWPGGPAASNVWQQDIQHSNMITVKREALTLQTPTNLHVDGLKTVTTKMWAREFTKKRGRKIPVKKGKIKQ